MLGEVNVHEGWFGHALEDLEAAAPIRIAYLSRFGEGMLPVPGTRLQQGDIVHAMMPVDATSEIEKALSTAPKPVTE